MNSLERHVRMAVTRSLRDAAQAPSATELAAMLGAGETAVVDALRSLADAHLLVLRPGSDDVWMASPFSAVPTDFVVAFGERTCYASCAWDGLSVLALVGDGTLRTHSPATGDDITLTLIDGAVRGDALVHFLVPAARFWDDIGFT
jgi:hypothetical protein